jgi:hypothetical protein
MAGETQQDPLRFSCGLGWFSVILKKPNTIICVACSTIAVESQSNALKKNLDLAHQPCPLVRIGDRYDWELAKGGWQVGAVRVGSREATRLRPRLNHHHDGLLVCRGQTSCRPRARWLQRDSGLHVNLLAAGAGRGGNGTSEHSGGQLCRYEQERLR